MRQTKLLFVVLTAAGFAKAQGLQIASPPVATSQNSVPQAAPPSGYFQHLPAMPVSPKFFQEPTKFQVISSLIGSAEAQLAPCAIPLIEAQPSAKVQYTIKTVKPPPGENLASAYVPAMPTCGESGKNPAVAKKFSGGFRK